MVLGALANECIYDGIDGCRVLIEKKCINCKFRKTRHEYYSGQQEAKRILLNKNLKPVQRRINGQLIMTTKEVYD